MSGVPVTAACLFFLLSLCSACYISNCPIGGKRSVIDGPLRKCMSCGPGERGRCFGPTICCGEGLGCLMGSPEASHCAEENYMLTPCQSGGRPCGSEGDAALPQESATCTTDQSCLSEEEGEEPLGQSEPNDIILKLLHLASYNAARRLHQ
uniref:Oxytocin n=1 Tax=Neogobius melanostomus TaxID=47308 RepID=A0A8C6US28_9GOBI